MKRRLIASAAALLCVASALSAVATAPADARPPRNHLQKPQVDPAVPTHKQHHVKPAAGAKDHTVGHLQHGAAVANRLPAASTATATLPAVAANAQVSTAHLTRAGQSPIAIGRVATRSTRAATAATPSTGVQVQVLPEATATAAGLDGVLFHLRQTSATATAVEVSVDYHGFRNAYGGDWAQRLQLVKLPACAATTPRTASCRTGTILASHNDPKAQTVSAATTSSRTDALYAAFAAPSGGTGSYAATSLSDAGRWQVSTQGGDFSWSYPINVPAVPGGLLPQVSLDYSSSAVDGQTATTNNQPSGIGLGWDDNVGFIERGYQSCADAYPASPTGDECWGTDNATLNFQGQSTPLVKVNNTTWRTANDEGETVQHLTDGKNPDDNGEYWVVTTTDGTKYYYGLNTLPGTGTVTPTNSVWTVPVFGADPENPRPGESFAASVRQQAYRWNLDYVVDPHADAIAYYYTTETNMYAERLGVAGAATGSYTRGGELKEIDYGLHDGHAYDRNAAAAQVDFTSADRCVAGATCSQHTAASYPDVPWDQSCTAAPCGTNYSPTFWSTQRLASITTTVWNGSTYAALNSWTLDQTYPDPGDKTGAGLWLHGITHTGLAGGSISTPEITFSGQTFQNRVNTATDGLAPMDKYRITSVNNESGGSVTVQYLAADCNPSALPTPDTNTTRCFPQIWTPPGDSKPITDWFAKFVVGSTTQSDAVGGNANEYVSYTYKNAGWEYNENPLVPVASRSWSQWAGYGTVQVTTGAADDSDHPRSSVTHVYYRGMNGDHLTSGTRTATVTDSQGGSVPDNPQDAGFERETITDNGVGGAVVSDVINTPWQNGPTATFTTPTGPLNAYMIEIGKSVTTTPLSAGGTRTTEVDTTYNTNDLVAQVSDLGDASTAKDDTCTTTTYATLGNAGILDHPSEVAQVNKACGTAPTLPADAISDITHTYNAQGDALTTAEAASYTGGKPVMLTTDTSTYDAYGRVTTSTDAESHTTTSSYVAPSSGAPWSEIDVTDPMQRTTKTTYDLGTGQALTVTAPGPRVTTSSYDALGRLSAVWLPGRPASAYSTSPSERFGYSVSNTAASWQSTATLDANSHYQTSYVLYDGFLRPRQTQTPTHGADATDVRSDIVDTLYDSHGSVARTTRSYDIAGAASGTLQVADLDDVPLATVTGYDGAERQTTQRALEDNQPVLDSAGHEWKTTIAYGGDHLDVTPPAGTTPTTTYTDARGNTTEIRDYHGSTPTGAYDATDYTYTPAGDPATVIDAAKDTWSYGYDVLGRQITSTDPDKGASSTTYGKDDEVTSTTDARGTTLAYVYDADGEKTEEHQTSTSGPLLGSWAYDPATGDLDGSNSFIGANEYTESTTYDPTSGRPKTESVVIPASETGLAGTYKTSLTYQPDGSPNTEAFPALGDLPAETLFYGYDALGAADSMHNGAASPSYYVAQASYGQDGGVSQMQLGPDSGGVVESFGHDVATDRPTSSLVQPDIGSGDIDAESYGYDLSGNLTSETDAMAGQATENQCFDYDYDQRLSQAWTTSAANCTGAAGSALAGAQPYWRSYSYDLLGDRTQLVQHATTAGVKDMTTTYTYGSTAHPQALTATATIGPSGTNTTAYGYNATGDTTTRPGGDGSAQTLTWDANDRLSGVTEGATTTGYVYDASGSLLVTHDGTGATLQLPYGEVHVDPTGQNATGTAYYSFAGHVVAVRTNGTLSYLDGDPHGTSDLSIDAATGAANKHRTDPFGQSLDSADLPGNKGFVGGTEDPTSGLETVGARAYDAMTGRFLSVDPLIDTDNPATLNPYVYAQDNPTTLSDPSGLSAGGKNCPDGDCTHGNTSAPPTVGYNDQPHNGPPSPACRSTRLLCTGGSRQSAPRKTTCTRVLLECVAKPAGPNPAAPKPKPTTRRPSSLSWSQIGDLIWDHFAENGCLTGIGGDGVLVGLTYCKTSLGSPASLKLLIGVGPGPGAFLIGGTNIGGSRDPKASGPSLWGTADVGEGPFAGSVNGSLQFDSHLHFLGAQGGPSKGAGGGDIPFAGGVSIPLCMASNCPMDMSEQFIQQHRFNGGTRGR